MNVKFETTNINNEDAIFLLDTKKNKCIYLTVDDLKELKKLGEINKNKNIKVSLGEDCIVATENGEEVSYKVNYGEILQKLEYIANRSYGIIDFVHCDFVSVILNDNREASFNVKDIKNKTKKPPIKEFGIRVSGDIKYINTDDVVILENIDFE